MLLWKVFWTGQAIPLSVRSVPQPEQEVASNGTGAVAKYSSVRGQN